jgi:hypothetical protein
MHDSIEYQSIIMRCDKIFENAFYDVSSKIEIIRFQTGMENVWGEIQKACGQFDTFTDEETPSYQLHLRRCNHTKGA